MGTTYSFLDTHASLSGPTGVVDLGYGAAVAEEGITVQITQNRNDLKVGADGQPMNTLRAAKNGTVTVRLLKTSSRNAILQAMYDAQSLSSQLWGNNQIVISQTNVGDLHSCAYVAFQKQPEINYKQDGDILEWVFDCGTVDTILGTY